MVICRLLWHAETAESKLLIKVGSDPNYWLKEKKSVILVLVKFRRGKSGKVWVGFWY